MHLSSERRCLVLPLALLLLFAAALRATTLHAQDAPDPDAPPPASKAPAQPQPQPSLTETLHLNVNLVDTYFSVRENNAYVTSLTQADCLLSEDHQPQSIKNLTQEKNLPLTIGILLDTSGSQQHVLPLEQQSGARFLKDVLTPKDAAFLISFDVNVDLLSDYTNSATELTRAINQASINAASSNAGIAGGPLPSARPRGTLLYDAIYLAAHDKLQSQAGRKVIILLTDGGDQGSQETLKSAEEAAQKANTIVYVILLADHSFTDAFGTTYSGKAQMEQLARDTGGRVIDVGNNGPKLEAAFDQVQNELRSQYLVSYTPINKTADGKYRKLDITCGPNRTVQARKGYYAIPSSEDGNH